jgi:hypothetical protein
MMESGSQEEWNDEMMKQGTRIKDKGESGRKVSSFKKKEESLT